jgi:hypothetical protein
MVIKFADKAIDCRHLRLLPQSIRLNDLVLHKGELCEVITIQRDCPRIVNLSKTFTMFTLRDREGRIIPCDSINGTREVYRPRSA